MERYNIHIILTDGREIDANVTADNQAAAMERLIGTNKFQEFVSEGDTEEEAVDVQRVTVTQIDEQEQQGERYLLQHSKQQPDGWVCTDTVNGIVCQFQEHRFNETSKMTFLEDVKQPDALTIASLMREMGDWLAANHNDIVF